jgi:hypothetical protein
MADRMNDTLYRRITLPHEVTPGTGGTVSGWCDRHAVTVLSHTVFKSGPFKNTVRTITVQRDQSVLLDNGGHGIYGQQEYDFCPDPNGAIETFTVDKRGAFKSKGKYSTLHVGSRAAYMNPSF